MSNKPPAFQFYPKDWLTDGQVLRLTMAQRGLYITLLALSWIEGFIPDDFEEICAMTGLSESAERDWKKVRDRFIPGPTGGTLVNKRLEEIRAEQRAYSERQSAAGKVGGKASGASREQNRSEATVPRGSSRDEATVHAGRSQDEAVVRSGLSESEAAGQAAPEADGNPERSSSPSPAPASAHTENTGGAEASSARPRGRAVRLAVPEGPSFGEPVESEVHTLIAEMASRNSTATITESRIASERRAIEQLLVETSQDAVVYGIREALRRGAPDLRYVAKCAKGYSPDNPRHVAVVGRPRPGERANRNWDDEVGLGEAS